MSHPADRPTLFSRLADVVIRLRVPILIVYAVCTAFFMFQVRTKLRFDSSVEYFAEGTEAHELLLKFQEDFGNDTYHIVMIRGDVFSPPFLERLAKLHASLEEFSVDGPRPSAPVAPVDAPAADPDALGFGPPPTPAPTGDPDALGFGPPPTPAPTGDPDALGFGPPPTPAPSGDPDALGFGPPPAAAPAENTDAIGFGAPEVAAEAAAEPELGSVSHVEEVTSLINVRQTVFEGGAVRVRGLMETMPTAEELPALKAKVLADPALVGNVVGPEGRRAVIMLRTTAVDFEGRERAYHALNEWVAPFREPGFDVAVTGMPALNAELVGTMQRDMRRLIASAYVVMGLVLLQQFRSWRGVVAPLMVVGMSSVWTLGLMAFLGVPVTLLTNIIPAFLAAVAIGDSIHIQSVYREGRTNGHDHLSAIRFAVASTGWPLVFTSLTTMVGMLSFLSAKMAAIGEMGVFTAFGVGVALCASLLFLPAAMAVAGDMRFPPVPKGSGNQDWIDRVLVGSTGLSARRSWPVLVGTAVLVAFMGVGVAQMKVYHNPLTWLAEDYHARVDLEEMDQQVGGTAQVNLVIDAATERGLRDRELLLALDRLEAHIRAYRNPSDGAEVVTGTSSLVDIVKETNRALHDGDPAALVIPDSQRGVSDALLLFESAAPRDLRRIATADLMRSHMTIRLHWMDATSYEPFTAWLEEGIEREIGGLATVRPTGSVYELVTIVSGLIGDLVRSFGTAFLSVLVMMVVLLRHPGLGLISMVPNLVPIALILGFMGFAGIPLDLTNLLIASIVVGVAVDNTVHYMFQWRESAWNLKSGTEAGIEYALAHAGRALVATGVILGLGFGVYLTSSMLNIRRFGMLVGAACVFALLTNLIMVPALLRLIFRDRAAK